MAAGKMSLFHIFSRPKVEKARGHREKGLDGPLPPKKSGHGLKSSASTANLASRMQSDAAAPPTPSIPSVHTPPAQHISKIKFKEPAKLPARERKTGSFDPPPLFQAYPQSTKDGMLELSLMSAETVQQKSRSRKAGGVAADPTPETMAEDTASMDAKRSTISHRRHVANGSITHVELPKKIFVLVTSGYLLQYPENGPTDRLPERMLHLGKDSAAFACDLVPGKHYVLQVAQAVDDEGIVVINSGSIFSKFGIRTAAAKRMTSNLLLVMPNAKEMESWMAAIKKEVEAVGGTKMKTGGASGRKTAVGDGDDLQRTPSQSNRHRVQRAPSTSTPLASPRHPPPPLPTPSPKLEKDKPDAATIDGIDMEAEKLTPEEPHVRARTRSPSDTPSISSSAAVSVDQQQLDNLRTSESNKRFSKASQAPTVATTVSNSRANSLSGSPPSEGFVTGSLDAVQESTSKPAYRSLASYGTRRRSAAPTSVFKDAQSPPPAIDTSLPKIRAITLEQDTESPVVGYNASLPSLSSPPTLKRLSLARSGPNLQSAAGRREKHDFEVPTPSPLRDAEKERPESFIGELPPPSTWSSNRAAARRTSLLQSASAMTAQAQNSPTQWQTPSSGSPSNAPRPPAETKSKRMSTFSIPLKINPSTPHSQPSPISSRRKSSAHDPDPPGETPVVHALTATVEPNRRASVAHTTITANGLSKSPSQRLSLFPSQLPSPPSGSVDLTSTPLAAQLAAAQSQAAAAQAQAAQANTRTLRRPTSMQVRSNHAPFLSSVRNPASPSAVRTFTAPAPIRGLKPSRSASNVPSLASTPDVPVDALRDLDFGLPAPNEDDDEPGPLPLPTIGARCASPLPPRPSSRLGSQRGTKTRSALPELDLGIPVVGLGPPAPPPSAPLPAPPTQSRPGSRLGSRPNSPAPANAAPMAGIDAIAGLGIRVS